MIAIRSISGKSIQFALAVVLSTIGSNIHSAEQCFHSRDGSVVVGAPRYADWPCDIAPLSNHTSAAEVAAWLPNQSTIEDLERQVYSYWSARSYEVAGTFGVTPKIEAAIKKNVLEHKYLYQYLPFIVDGVQLVCINAILRVAVEPSKTKSRRMVEPHYAECPDRQSQMKNSGNWRVAPIIFFDASVTNWRAIYNVREKAIQRVDIL
jgi:hypothetical protein